jgi:hypothetical protein
MAWKNFGKLYLMRAIKMKSVKDIKQEIRKLKVASSDKIHNRVLADLAKVLDKSKKQTAVTQPIVWRIIMNKPITKFVAAAVVIIGMGMGVYLIDKAATPAWAIDQSIEAMKNYRGIYFSGTMSMSWKDFFDGLEVKDLSKFPGVLGEFEMWAQADEDFLRSSAVKMIYPDNIVILGGKLHTYVQLADGTIYDVQGDHMKIDPWPTSKLLEILKKDKANWTELYGMDAETGKKRIFVKCSSADANRCWELEFDSESKLLVSLKQWDESNNYEGLPTIDVRKIVYYEQLPDEMFDINLPDPAKIITISSPLYDRAYGMDAEGLSKEHACHKILEEFWQAANEQDLDKVRKLFPYSVEWNDEMLKKNLTGDNAGSVRLLELGQMYESKIGPVVPCIVQCDGEKKVIDMIVMFREIGGKSSCVVHSNKGQPRPVE